MLDCCFILGVEGMVLHNSMIIHRCVVIIDSIIEASRSYRGLAYFLLAVGVESP